MAMVAAQFPDHLGDLEPMYLAVTHTQAQAVLADFIAHRLPRFGDYQDAMVQGEPWLYNGYEFICRWGRIGKQALCSGRQLYSKNVQLLPAVSVSGCRKNGAKRVPI